MEHQCEHEGFKREEIKAVIDKYDCYLAILEADNYLPGFVYSIGLYEKFGHPEIICFGLSSNLMGTLINDVCAWVKKGNNIETYIPYPDFLEDSDVQFLPVHKEFYSDYLGYGIRYYDISVDFPAIQMVWTDTENNFPWDEKFDPDFKFRQPLLDRNTDFKFYEEKNLSVFTTEQALAGESVLYVYHDIDGDWQFHTNDDPDLDDAKIVCLKDIVAMIHL